MADLMMNQMRNTLRNLQHQIDVLRSKSTDGIFGVYTPTLTATTTNPTLGTSSSTSGKWCRIGDFVFATGDIRFGTAGTAAGSGTYQISLPFRSATPQKATTDSVEGHWRATTTLAGSTSFNTNDLLIQTGVSVMTAKYSLTYPTGTDTFVTHNTPFAWAANHRISFTVIYEAAAY
jgi:hypothetical protein